MIGAVLGRGRRRGAGWRVGVAASMLAASTVVSVIAAGSVASAAPNDFDTTFGPPPHSTGVVQYSTGSGASATGVAVTSAGNIVVSTDGGGAGGQFEVARFTPTGAIDNTFGTSGNGLADAFAGQANAVAIVPAGFPGAGNIVAAGEQATGPTTTCPAQSPGTAGEQWPITGEQPVVAEYTPAGQLVTTTDIPTGTLCFPPGSPPGTPSEPSPGFFDGVLNAVTIDGSGNIVVAGQVFSPTGTLETLVARLTPAGALDTTFASTGVTVLPIGTYNSAAQGVAVSGTGGDIYTAGYSYVGSSPPVRYLTVAAFNPTTGALDTTFGQSGLLTPSQSNTGAFGATVLPNGNVVVVGAVNASTSSPEQAFLAQYTSAGAPAAGFGTNGAVTPPNLPSYTSSAYHAVAYQPEGLLVVAGSATSTTSQDMLVAQYHSATGIPNSPFGGGSGALPIPDPTDAEGVSSLAAVAVQADGRAVVAGDAPIINNSPDLGLARVQVPVPRPYTPLSAARICDTRPGNGLTGPAAQCNNRRMAANTSLTLQVAGHFGVPANASAVVVNLTTVNPTGAGFLTAYPAGTARPATSNITVANAQAVAGLAEVALSGGALTVFSSVSTGLFVGLEGYTAPASLGPPGAGLYNALPLPVRVCDTRVHNPSGLSGTAAQCNNTRLLAGNTRQVKVAGVGFGVPAGATAVVANLRAVAPAGTGVLTAYADGAPPAGASTLSYVAGPGMTLNRVVIPLLADGKVDVFAGAPTDVILDISGYYTAAAGTGTGFVPEVTPVRICDTRAGTGLVGPAAQCNGQPLGPNSTRSISVADTAGDFSVPRTATSVVVNVTAVNPTVATALFVYPGTRPAWTDLNPPAGGTESNLVLSTLSPSGTILIQNTAGTTNLFVDLEGYYTGAGS